MNLNSFFMIYINFFIKFEKINKNAKNNKSYYKFLYLKKSLI